MTFGNEDLTVRCDHDAGRLVQGVRGIACNAALADREQHLAFGAELDDRVAFAGVLRMLLSLTRIHAAHIDDPHVAVAIDIDLVREDEHARAEALEEIPCGVELQYRRQWRTGATVVLKRR